MSFKNKVVLITGSGSGMGEATAILFAKEGADVVIVDIKEDTAKKTGEECRKFDNKVLVINADISNDVQAKNTIDATIKNFGKLDVLVNNAGIVRKGKLIDGNIMDTFDEVLNVNLRAVVSMTSLATPHLIATKGCIVNVSSVAANVPQKGSTYPAYAVSKAGVDSFTKLAALELAPSGVRVNAVRPGPVHTNILAYANEPGIWDELDEATALKKDLEASEIADLIVFLASDKAKSITGVSYTIDNGMCLI
ncbi:meso-2,3-butanediol dehydrogenase-like [Anticarsia gemmatalis]|uniref:meso-2,3-butanediol dehydrogenase-like n=1 Tax=Anticarsia gemmatalis TaxID=129554 RepID=UPI003F7774C3